MFYMEPVTHSPIAVETDEYRPPSVEDGTVDEQLVQGLTHLLDEYGEGGVRSALDQLCVNQALLRSTVDAAVWAREFRKVYPECDEGTMIGWFANCWAAAVDLK